MVLMFSPCSDLKDQFHLMGMNLALAVLVGSIAMVASDLHAVRDDRHWCTAIGTLIHFFCQAAGAWVFCLGHAAHRAVTAGDYYYYHYNFFSIISPLSPVHHEYNSDNYLRRNIGDGNEGELMSM